jgi:hypothetical protein
MSISALTAALAAFNLICTGTLTSKMGSKPSATTYRVDLVGRRYCYDECLETRPIRALTDREIIFENGRFESGGRHRRTVNRKSGRIYDHVVVGPSRFEMKTDAICRTAPFTGFPTRRF